MGKFALWLEIRQQTDAERAESCCAGCVLRGADCDALPEALSCGGWRDSTVLTLAKEQNA